MEDVERQEEREGELRSDMDRLERRGDDLEEQRERLDKQVENVREEFERKKESSEVPGAQPSDDEVRATPPGDAAGGAPRTEADE